MNRLVDICENKDYILKITYHKHVGWNVRMHKNGYDIPTINVINKDKNIAFDNAYEEMITKIVNVEKM